MALFAVLALAVLSAPAAAQQPVGQPKGMEMSTPKSRTATITGTVVDVSCKFGQGLAGADHKVCAEVCSDRGIPLAILGSDGKLYLPTSAAMPGDAQNARLKAYAEQKVKVTGKVFEAGGANAIQIASIDRGS
jgi:hypothetical protein